MCLLRQTRQKRQNNQKDQAREREQKSKQSKKKIAAFRATKISQLNDDGFLLKREMPCFRSDGSELVF